jgi:hypothetical protein
VDCQTTLLLVGLRNVSRKVELLSGENGVASTGPSVVLHRVVVSATLRKRPLVLEPGAASPFELSEPETQYLTMADWFDNTGSWTMHECRTEDLTALNVRGRRTHRS